MIRRSLRYRSGDKQKSYRYKEELDSIDIPEWKKQVIYEATPTSCTHFPSLLHLANTVEHIVQNNIPGDFVECGVHMGGSCMVMAGILKHYNSNRRILMYDTYDGVPVPNSSEITLEGDNLQNWYKENKLDEDGNSMWCYSSIDDVKYNMNSVGYDGEIQYIQGDVMNTLPDNSSNSIALLRIDVDLYEPTQHVLEHLYNKLSNKGSLILDDYGHFPKVKETVDNFLQDRVSDLEEITYTVRHLVK